MDMLQIFGLQFVLSLVVFSLLAAWRFAPWLDRQALPEALFWLALPHAFRHVGLVFLVPGVVDPALPGSFSAAAGYGDLAAGLLAILSLIALRQRWVIALLLVWLLNIVGLVDLANALRQVETVPYFQAAWYIPTFVVPMLLVTHVMMVTRLVRAMTGTARDARSKA